MGPGRAGARGPCGGAHRYRSPVPWDDDADDDAARLGPPPPADDRLWRHPYDPGEQQLHGLAATTTAATRNAPRRAELGPLAHGDAATGEQAREYVRAGTRGTVSVQRRKEPI